MQNIQVCMYHFNQYSTGKAKTKDLTSHWSKYTWNPSVSNLDTVCGISNLSSTMIQALESVKCFIIFDVKNTKVDHATYQWPRRTSAWHSSGTRDGIRSACHKKTSSQNSKDAVSRYCYGQQYWAHKIVPTKSWNHITKNCFFIRLAMFAFMVLGVLSSNIVFSWEGGVLLFATTKFP